MTTKISLTLKTLWPSAITIAPVCILAGGLIYSRGNSETLPLYLIYSVANSESLPLYFIYSIGNSEQFNMENKAYKLKQAFFTYILLIFFLFSFLNQPL